MLNIDDIAYTFDELETTILDSNATFEELLEEFKGFNVINDNKFKQFDFDDGNYTFTIEQIENDTPRLSNHFIIWTGADGIEFERS